MSNINQTIIDAKQFVHDNLAKCCSELVKWNATNMLEEGKIRQLVAILKPLYQLEIQALMLAETLIKNAAVEQVADQPQ